MSRPRPAGPRRVPWHTVLIALLTVGLLWRSSSRSIDLREAWRAILQRALSAGSRPPLLVTLQTYVLRAWRWQVAPRSRSADARFRTAFRTTVIGFTATFLLPARVGEVLRPYLLARQERLRRRPPRLPPSSSSACSTSCTVLLLFASGAVPSPASTSAARSRRRVSWPPWPRSSAWACCSCWPAIPSGCGRWAGRLARRLPARRAAHAGQRTSSRPSPRA